MGVVDPSLIVNRVPSGAVNVRSAIIRDSCMSIFLLCADFLFFPRSITNRHWLTMEVSLETEQAFLLTSSGLLYIPALLACVYQPFPYAVLLLLSASFSMMYHSAQERRHAISDMIFAHCVLFASTIAFTILSIKRGMFDWKVVGAALLSGVAVVFYFVGGHGNTDHTPLIRMSQPSHASTPLRTDGSSGEESDAAAAHASALQAAQSAQSAENAAQQAFMAAQEAVNATLNKRAQSYWFYHGLWHAFAAASLTLIVHEPLDWTMSDKTYVNSLHSAWKKRSPSDAVASIGQWITRSPSVTETDYTTNSPRRQSRRKSSPGRRKKATK